MKNKELHEKILYPVTRVRCGKGGGSGVLVYSKPDPKTNKYINVVLTCQHVIADAIKLEDRWDTVLKREVKKDIMEEVAVEIFQYDDSTVVSSNSTQAKIIAYDEHHDLAAVQLNNNHKMDYTASILPKDEIDDLRLFDPTWTSGCSLLHDPFANPGTLTYLRELIEQKSYIMTNASSVFGNSGGGLFHGDRGHLLGLTSRITSMQLGFGIDVMTWMGFSTHPERMYEFFDHQELQFLYDDNDTFEAGRRRREAKRKNAIKSFLMSGQDLGEPTKKEEVFSEEDVIGPYGGMNRVSKW